MRRIFKPSIIILIIIISIINSFFLLFFGLLALIVGFDQINYIKIFIGLLLFISSIVSIISIIGIFKQKKRSKYLIFIPLLITFIYIIKESIIKIYNYMIGIIEKTIVFKIDDFIGVSLSNTIIIFLIILISINYFRNKKVKRYFENISDENNKIDDK